MPTTQYYYLDASLALVSGRYALPALVGFLISAYVAFRVRRSARIDSIDAAATKSTGKGVERVFGNWEPVEFEYPPIHPCELELKDIKPIPYRPFRWGKYNVTMGLRTMPWDDWIELDNQYDTYQRIRAHRIKTRGPKAIRVLGDDANPGVVGGGGEAAIELVHELAEYLSRRYPKTFAVVRWPSKEYSSHAHCDWGWEGAPAIKSITYLPSELTYDLPLSVEDGARAPERALEVAAMLVQDDLALMIEGVDGRYYFQAGAICVPGFWRMEDKIGLALDEIHITGNVPQYKERLHTSMERFFRRLPVDKPVIRNNYFVQVVRPRKSPGGDENRNAPQEVDPEELGWSESTNGMEDEYEHGRAFTRPSGSEEPTAEMLRVRSERQTLRRLGRSGGIVFTIRTYIVGVEELAREEGVAGRLASAVGGWPEDVGEYKGRSRGGWWDVLVMYLDSIA